MLELLGGRGTNASFVLPFLQSTETTADFSLVELVDAALNVSIGRFRF
jgi:hypothetical protein